VAHLLGIREGPQLAFLSIIGARGLIHLWPADQRRHAALVPNIVTVGHAVLSRSVYSRARRSLLTVLHSLFSGLLSGLETQKQISELLDELYYDGLPLGSWPREHVMSHEPTDEHAVGGTRWTG
jgi:hypothetical protein